jgi:hypothetical protein
MEKWMDAGGEVATGGAPPTFLLVVMAACSKLMSESICPDPRLWSAFTGRSDSQSLALVVLVNL